MESIRFEVRLDPVDDGWLLTLVLFPDDGTERCTSILFPSREQAEAARVDFRHMLEGMMMGRTMQ
jgi:hypothetical protein